MNSTVDFRQQFQNDKKMPSGLKIARVVTTYPDATTIVLEGGKFALDVDIFEIPVSCYPLIKNDKFLAFPIRSSDIATRYGILSKLTTGQAVGTMQGSSSVLVDGMVQAYSGDTLILPSIPLVAGDRVTVTPTGAAEQIKYIISKI